MPRPTEPTEQQLREACARMARRFRWLDAFETVMQDPVRRRLVRVAAMHPTAAGTPARRPAAAPGWQAPRRQRRPLPFLDLKRAAAGERDDD
ncbi:hypothetical protein DBA29_22375 [Xenophilus aerolatus]|nr:hypothetical protein [Xenophilus aerolatus]